MQKMSIEASLGSTIRKHRLDKKISQEGLGYKCNLHRTYIGSIERGERNISLLNIVTIAKALDMTGGKLLTDADI